MSQEFVSGKEQKGETGTERMKSTETEKSAQLLHNYFTIYIRFHTLEGSSPCHKTCASKLFQYPGFGHLFILQWAQNTSSLCSLFQATSNFQTSLVRKLGKIKAISFNTCQNSQEPRASCSSQHRLQRIFLLCKFTSIL